MTGKKVYEVFKSMFPDYAAKTIKWVDKKNSRIFIFCEGSTISFEVLKNGKPVRMEVTTNVRAIDKVQ